MPTLTRSSCPPTCHAGMMMRWGVGRREEGITLSPCHCVCSGGRRRQVVVVVVVGCGWGVRAWRAC